MARPKGRHTRDPNAPRPEGVRPISRTRKDAGSASWRHGQPRKGAVADLIKHLPDPEELEPIRRSSRQSVTDNDSFMMRVGSSGEKFPKRKSNNKSTSQEIASLFEITETDEEEIARPPKRRPAIHIDLLDDDDIFENGNAYTSSRRSQNPAHESEEILMAVDEKDEVQEFHPIQPPSRSILVDQSS
ncbi:hypothetical protein NUW58_g5927 [Xylaria curta]|uniref:Uncharacterized protein n=1 Tax=Xylaria curta TaxID=42375 RepID=A0ACC1NZ87_9PEZI|nr:hypothetical protein NUW58_g5927 [Xylaria curta]